MAHGLAHNLVGFQRGLRHKEGHLRSLSINDKGCVLYAPLNSVEGGKVKDLSGKGNNGTVHGAVLTNIGDQYPISWKDKLINIGGKAMSFDGSDDYVDCGDFVKTSLTEDYTIELWIKPNSITDGKNSAFGWHIMSIGNNNGKVYFDQCYDGNWHKGYQYTSPTVLLNTSKFSHIVGVYKRDTGIYLYVDGNYIGCDETKTGTDVNINDPARIGEYYVLGYYPFNGLIDEVRIYNRALSASEIGEHYRILKPLFI